jgi:hypothetical protein
MSIKDSFQEYVNKLDTKIEDKELRASELKAEGREVKADKIQKKAAYIKTQKDCFKSGLANGGAEYYSEVDEICNSDKGKPHARKIRIAALNAQNQIHSRAFITGTREDNKDKNQISSEIVMKCDHIASNVTNLVRSLFS